MLPLLSRTDTRIIPQPERGARPLRLVPRVGERGFHAGPSLSEGVGFSRVVESAECPGFSP